MGSVLDEMTRISHRTLLLDSYFQTSSPGGYTKGTTCERGIMSATATMK